MLLFTLPENQLLLQIDYLKVSPVKTGEVSIYVYSEIPTFCVILKMSNQFPYGTAAEVQLFVRKENKNI